MRNLVFLAAVTVLLALSVVSILKKAKGRVKALQVAGFLALAAAAVYWWFNPSWAYPEPTGPYAVEAVGSTYTDNNHPETYAADGSNRWLNVAFWYPSDYAGGAHTLPLIVFSHGSFGVKESNESLFRELASHGYVVCSMDHTYQCLGTTSSGGKKVGMDRAYMKQVLSSSDKSAEKRQELAQLFSEWMAIRMGDIAFVLDTVKACADSDDTSLNGVYQLIDTSKIGVMGHSLGGSAALGIGRARGDIDAVVALEAPFMYDVKGVENGAFVWEDAPYPVPVLNVYTDSSWDKLSTSPQYAQNYAVLNDGSDMTCDIYVKGAGHMTLTDLTYSRPPLCLLFGQNLFFDTAYHAQKLNGTYLDFFNCTLKDGGVYKPASFDRAA